MSLTKTTVYEESMEETHTILIEGFDKVIHIWKNIGPYTLKEVYTFYKSADFNTYFIPKEEAEVYVALAKLRGECMTSKFWHTIPPRK